MTSEAASKDTLAGQLMLVSAVLFSIAFATILLALMFERYGGYAPCPLCLQERYAYYFAVPATVIAFFTARAESFTLDAHPARADRPCLPHQCRRRRLSFRRRVEMVAGPDLVLGRHRGRMGRGRSQPRARARQGGELQRSDVALRRPLLRRMECGDVGDPRRSRRLRRAASAVNSPVGRGLG